MSTANNTRLAAIYSLTSMFGFGFIDNIVRIAAESGSMWQFQVMRSGLSLIALGAISAIWGIRILPVKWRSVALRSVVAGLSMVIYFGCLSFFPISIVVAGLFTSPLWVVLISVFFFREHIGPRRIFAVILGFAGILMTLGGETGTLSLLSILPVSAGLFYGLGNLATRRWCAAENGVTLLAGYAVAILIFGLAFGLFLQIHPMPVPEGRAGFVFRDWVVPDLMFTTVIAVNGLGALVGIYFLIRAYQMADATFVSVLENSLLVFATIWAIILWQEWPTPRTVIGLFMILAAATIITVRSDSPPASRADTLVE